ncbi:MAG: DUF4235 domain-containing protein [Nitriliruptor sp.]|uniref:DUF4235 domain-containing protein n=1 Tax=Nitriliruptor sp. TaxID=2448056 RepID=UPI0034A07CEC
MRSAVWKSLVSLSSIGAAVAARNAAVSLWEHRTGHEPPANPADPQTSWGEAIAWTVATGVLIGIARLFARRGAAMVWKAVDGELPPELEAAGPA